MVFARLRYPAHEAFASRIPLTYSRVFMDKRMAQVVPLDSLGDEWTGYEAKITGGNDKQGFP